MSRPIRLLSRLLVVPFAVAGALLCPQAAPSTTTLTPGFDGVSQLSAVAGQYAPGVAVPTRFPATVTQFSPGYPQMEGLDGYSRFAPFGAVFASNNPVKPEGFLLVVYLGNKVNAMAAAVTTHLRQGGWAVDLASFTAGRYRGTVLSLGNGEDKRQIYMWAAGGHSYAITVLLHEWHTPKSNTWSKRALIASFRVP